MSLAPQHPREPPQHSPDDLARGGGGHVVPAVAGNIHHLLGLHLNNLQLQRSRRLPLRVVQYSAPQLHKR